MRLSVYYIYVAYIDWQGKARNILFYEAEFFEYDEYIDFDYDYYRYIDFVFTQHPIQIEAFHAAVHAAARDAAGHGSSAAQVRPPPPRESS